MIKNIKQLINNGKITKRKKVRQHICNILERVLEAIDPYKLVKENLQRRDNKLFVADSLRLNLSEYEHIYVVGGGKAVYKMALAVEEILGNKITDGWINIPDLPKKNKLKKVRIGKARHPTPDVWGVRGAKIIKNILEKAGKDDLVLGVISGGGSSCMPLPAAGINLSEKIKLTSLLLKTPATIHEINVVRKHLSQIKGGQMACSVYPATMVTMYISDIIDDPFDIQASGPTAPDPSTFQDAIDILQKYDIWKAAPKNIHKRLLAGVAGKIEETPGPKHKAFCEGRVYNFTIGNHNTAVKAAAAAGKKLGYQCLELTSAIQGEAKEVAKVMIAFAKHVRQYKKPVKKPALLIAGGETTVHVQGKGRGGRNQELILSGLRYLQRGMTLASFGTDGVDGINPVPVAGAIADAATLEKVLSKKLNIQEYLDNNDSYHFFKILNEHIHTGYTGTNVGDLILLAVV